ncbi:ABC transporter substrate-binding protein [Patulibacter sp. SYSU D01012]|uniref:ABC transporter substrate-binding protein n=1 Tax=Patulibacter sp. SYSU D01012 TaxID=2817381 RepID=UPI001B30767C
MTVPHDHDHLPLLSDGVADELGGHGALTRAALLRRAGALALGVGAPGVLAACGNSAYDTGSSRARGAGADAPVAAVGTGSSSGSRALKVGYLPITDAAPLLVAHARGLYEEAGLEVPRPTLLRSWPALAEAFQGGAVDVVHILMPLALQLRFQQRLPVKVVAWNHTDGSAITVRREIADVEDLAGTTVAIPGWFSVHNVALQILLRARGLRPTRDGRPRAADRTVRLTVMAPADMPPALVQGSIAGYVVADPFNAVAEVKGIGRILRFTGDVWRQHACCVVAVREELIRDRPDAARALVGAVVRAQRLARDDRAGVARILTGERYLPQPAPAVARALTHGSDPAYVRDGAIVHPEWQEPRIDFRPYPFPSYTAELIDRLRETVVDGDLSFLRGLDGGRAHRELVDDTLVRAAIDAAGGPAAFGLPADLSRREEIRP